VREAAARCDYGTSGIRGDYLGHAVLGAVSATDARDVDRRARVAREEGAIVAIVSRTVIAGGRYERDSL